MSGKKSSIYRGTFVKLYRAEKDWRREEEQDVAAKGWSVC